MNYRTRLCSGTAFALAASVVLAVAAHAESSTSPVAGIPVVTKVAVTTSAALEEKAVAGVKSAPPPVVAESAGASPPCSTPPELARFGQPLTHTARLLAGGLPIKIVAIGSSSTAGAGASSPEASYPSRLAVELAEKFPRQEFTVVNRGVNGEEAANMVARFETAVIAEKPDLVLWQVGTNTVLRDQPLSPASSFIEQGVARLKETGADVILIDPQFAPKVIAKSAAAEMVDLLAVKAKQYNVNLFRRFAVMRDWRERQGLAFETFVSSDQLHMNDWSYACVAKVLSVAIAEAATRPTASASAQPAR